MGYHVTIVEVNGLTFGPGVFRTLVINSQSGITQPAIGELFTVTVFFVMTGNMPISFLDVKDACYN